MNRKGRGLPGLLPLCAALLACAAQANPGRSEALDLFSRTTAPLALRNAAHGAVFLRPDRAGLARVRAAASARLLLPLPGTISALRAVVIR